MFNPKGKVIFTVEQIKKIRDVIEFMIRDTNHEISSFYSDQCTLKTDLKVVDYNSSTYETISFANFLIFFFPIFFGVGEITINLSNPGNLIDYYHNLYLKQVINEEISEEIRDEVKVENYEESRV